MEKLDEGIKTLLDLGKRRGFLTFDQVNDFLPDEATSPERIHGLLETLDEMGIELPDTLYGLYQGTPLTERHWSEGNDLPDRITIYQRPIEEDAEDDEDARDMIAETLIHEVGHYFGLSEEEIEEIEEKYWRGEDQ